MGELSFIVCVRQLLANRIDGVGCGERNAVLCGIAQQESGALRNVERYFIPTVDNAVILRIIACFDRQFAAVEHKAEAAPSVISDAAFSRLYGDRAAFLPVETPVPEKAPAIFRRRSHVQLAVSGNVQSPYVFRIDRSLGKVGFVIGDGTVAHQLQLEVQIELLRHQVVAPISNRELLKARAVQGQLRQPDALHRFAAQHLVQILRCKISNIFSLFEISRHVGHRAITQHIVCVLTGDVDSIAVLVGDADAVECAFPLGIQREVRCHRRFKVILVLVRAVLVRVPAAEGKAVQFRVSGLDNFFTMHYGLCINFAAAVCVKVHCVACLAARQHEVCSSPISAIVGVGNAVLVMIHRQDIISADCSAAPITCLVDIKSARQIREIIVTVIRNGNWIVVVVTRQRMEPLLIACI